MTDREINGIVIEKHGAGYNVTFQVWIPGTLLPFTLTDVYQQVSEATPSGTGPIDFDDPDQPATPAEKKRRGRGAAKKEEEQVEETTEEETEEEEKPKRGRGRPKKKAEDDAKEEKPKRGRGRPKKEPEPEPEPEPEEEGISDEDLMLAVNDAREEIGADVIMEILEEFGVASVDELDQEQREEFIEILENEVNGGEED